MSRPAPVAGPIPARRSTGLLLIGLVLFSAAVIPNSSSRAVTGTAQAAPVPGPPAVGDCVTDPIDPGWNHPGVPPVAPGITTGTYTYPEVGIRQCQSSRYGEITALIGNPVRALFTPTSGGPTSSTAVADSNLDTCQAAAFHYVGIATTGKKVAPLVAGWYPQLLISTAVSTPSIRQEAAGQHWLACIVYLLGRYDSRPVADQERYDRSIRGALFTGQERDRTGMCVPGDDLSGGASGLVRCGNDHRGEIFGLGSTDDHPMARSELQRSCRRVVARLTNIPDIAAAGLTVQMVPTDTDQVAVDGAVIPAHTNLGCGVTTVGHRILTGSLLDIGSRPIPWK